MKANERENIPTIRIQRIEMHHFKSVQHGDIVLNCSQKDSFQDEEADILGIYGQNGSGKTAVIEAISILRSVMAGETVHPKYSEYISNGADYSELTFTFGIYHPLEDILNTVYYSFKICAIANDAYLEPGNPSFTSLYPTKVRVFDETISASGIIDGKPHKKQDILTTYGSLSEKSYPIGPVRKISQYVGNSKKIVEKPLEVIKEVAATQSSSFVFRKETLDLFEQHANHSYYYLILKLLNYYATWHLHAVDTRTSGIGAYYGLPISTRSGILIFNLMKPSRLSQNQFADFKAFIESVNTVLPTIIPNLLIDITYDELLLKGQKEYEVTLHTLRENTRLPLRTESSGIVKLICILSLIIAAFNDRLMTIAIDEFDAGIYEYLLGEIISALQTYGKGQFIFTSHNLRPLEVLKKDSLIFTTSSPDNRFIRLKGVGQTNNIRDLYFREVFNATHHSVQSGKLYDSEGKQRMVAALMKAGDGLGEK